MDFLDPKLKKNHRRRLFLGYALMAVLIAMGTMLLWFFSFGFNFDPTSNKVVQNGLVFVDSHPESAEVFVDGKSRGNTDMRMVLPAGNYNFELKRAGYRTWSHKLNLEGASLERLVYPFIFPEEMVSVDQELFSVTPDMSTQSPDRKWLLLHEQSNLNQFRVGDLSEEEVRLTPISLSAGLLEPTGSKHVIEPLEWSTDNRHLVIRHSFASGAEFVLIDRQSPDKSINLTKHFGTKFDDMKLKDKKFNRYYLHDKASGVLSSAELESKRITNVAEKVAHFQPYEDKMIIYATVAGEASETAEIRLRDGDKDYKLRDIAKSPVYLLDMAKFAGKWHVTAGSSKEQKAYIYIDPFSELKSRESRLPAPKVLLRLNRDLEYLSFSANARFIAVQSGSQFAVYDAEQKRQYRFDTKLNIQAGNEAVWMDGHRLMINSDGKLRIFEFNGENMQTLVDLSKIDNSAFFNRDYNRLFSLSPSAVVKDKTALVMTEMRYEEAQKSKQ